MIELYILVSDKWRFEEILNLIYGDIQCKKLKV